MTSAQFIRSNSRRAHLTRLLLVPAVSLIVAGGLIGMNSPESAAPRTDGSTINSPVAAAPASVSTMWQRPTASYFFVGSVAQHDEVVAEQERETERRRAGGEPEYLFAVFVVNDFDSEVEVRDRFNEFKHDWERNGVRDIKTIDLRMHGGSVHASPVDEQDYLDNQEHWDEVFRQQRAPVESIH